MIGQTGDSVKLEVYCDESRPELATSRREFVGDKKLLIGGIWLEAKERRHLKRSLREHRDRHKVGSEFKWNRVAPRRAEFYRGLVDIFFASPARFRCLVLPAAQLDALQFHDGDHELMFYKFYWQLLNHWIVPGNSYRIFLDVKTNRLQTRVTDLHRVLQNANIASRIESVTSVPSGDLDILQLADVLTGVVGFKFFPGTSIAKLAVLSQAERHLGREICHTWRDEQKFNVFCWRPGEW